MSVKWICDSCQGESDEAIPTLSMQALDVELQVELCGICAGIWKELAESLLDDMLVTLQEQKIEKWGDMA